MNRDTINFGILRKNHEKLDSIIITNNGTYALVIDSIVSNNDDFIPLQNSFIIEPASQRSLYIKFLPNDTGYTYGNIFLYNNASSSPFILSCTGYSVYPLISVIYDTINFGFVKVNTQRIDTLTIYNLGNDTLLIDSISSTNQNFLFYPANLLISPGSSKNLIVIFSPTDTGQYRGKIIIFHNSDNSPLEINLLGYGVSLSVLISSKIVNFDSVRIFDYKTDSIYIFNLSQLTIKIDSINLMDTMHYNYSFTENIILPNQKSVVKITFLPVDTIFYQTMLFIYHNGDISPDTVMILGQGVIPILSFSKKEITFNVPEIGLSKTDSILLFNKGNALLNIYRVSSSDSHFIVSSQRLSIPPYESKTLYITFVPDTIRFYNAFLIIESNSLIEIDTITLVGMVYTEVLSTFTKPYKNYLYQNYPNPFNSLTNIKYDVNQEVLVTLKIYNVLGELLTVLVNEIQKPGTYTIVLDTEKLELNAGIYFYQIKIGNYASTKKMILLK